MRRSIRAVLCVLGSLVLTGCAEAAGNAAFELNSEPISRIEEESTEDYQRSLVYLQNTETEGGICGSGFIISETENEICICTCAHVIEEHDSFEVSFYDGTVVEGKKLGVSAMYDVGLLLVDRSNIVKSTNDKLTSIKYDIEAWKAYRDSDGELDVFATRVGREGIEETPRRGRILEVMADFNWGNKLKHTKLDIELTDGDSGLAIVDTDGKLVSMHYGTSVGAENETQWGVPLSAILSSVEEILTMNN